MTTRPLNTRHREAKALRSLAEFLDWEEQQPLRYEFDGVQPIEITGGTAAHAFIQRNLAISIGGRLRGQACQAWRIAGHYRVF